MFRIGFIIPTLSNGGAERVVSLLSQYFSDKENYKVFIFLFKNDVVYNYGGKLINLNLNFNKNRNPIIKYSNWKNAISIMNYEKKRRNLDVVISFLTYSNLLNIFSKNKENTIISIRNNLDGKLFRHNNFYNFCKEMIIKQLYKKHSIVSVSKKIKVDLLKKFNFDEKKIKVIYNPIDINKINKLKKKSISSNYSNLFKKKVVINVGSLDYQKGQWHLIKAFKKVKQKINDDVVLLILGKGNYEKSLKKLASKLGLSKDIYFLGFVKNPYKYIYNSDIFVLSSLYEGLPNVLLESFTCGTPVISTDCVSGPKELLAPDLFSHNKKIKDINYCKYGILIPPFSLEQCERKMFSAKNISKEKFLSESILKLIFNDKLHEKYKMKGKKRSFDFSISNIGSVWEELLKKI